MSVATGWGSTGNCHTYLSLTRKCYSVVASEGEFYEGGYILLSLFEPVMTSSMNFRNTEPPMWNVPSLTAEHMKIRISR